MKSKILDAVHQIATGLHTPGAITDVTMREFEKLYLHPLLVSRSTDPDMKKAPQALLRASEKACLLAEQTGTRFVVRKSAIASESAKPK